MIAESLSEEEIAGLREMFQAMDTDNSGAITFDELKAGLRRYGSTLKDIEIRDLMEAVGCWFCEKFLFCISCLYLHFYLVIIFKYNIINFLICESLGLTLGITLVKHI